MRQRLALVSNPLICAALALGISNRCQALKVEIRAGFQPIVWDFTLSSHDSRPIFSSMEFSPAGPEIHLLEQLEDNETLGQRLNDFNKKQGSAANKTYYFVFRIAKALGEHGEGDYQLIDSLTFGPISEAELKELDKKTLYWNGTNLSDTKSWR